MKKWLLERRKLFQMRDELSADIVPKGVLIMGISGCGKSLAVKAIASCFELPLYRIDMIEVFSGRHGKPEGAFVARLPARWRRWRRRWCGSTRSRWASAPTSRSGGELGRIFAFFLTWMQEKTRGLFVAATANRIDLLPAEMIRKGRFDEVFFVDLPADEERLEIFRDPPPSGAASIPSRSTSSRSSSSPGAGRAPRSSSASCRRSPPPSSQDRELTGDDLLDADGQRRAAVEDHEGAGRPHPGLGVRPRGAGVAEGEHPVAAR